MRLEIDLLKRTASVLAFGTVLWLGAGTVSSVEAHDQYHDSGNHQKQEKRAEKRHQKNEKQALKDHQREERYYYYGNDSALRRHQQQERDDLKYHQRYEKDRRKQHQNYERDGYYYNDQNRRRYGWDRYNYWR